MKNSMECLSQTPEQENVGRKEMFTVSYCTKTNPGQNRDPWLFKVISTPAAILEHNDVIGVAKEKYNRLAAISESFNAISSTLHWINHNKNACDSKDCHGGVPLEGNRWYTCSCWEQVRNDRRHFPGRMEIILSWCVRCADMGIRGDYECCYPYHSVLTRGEELIVHAVDWRASHLTEQIDKTALHWWASICHKTID